MLPLRVIPQPTPALNADGDCGACVLGGLLNLSVREAYSIYGDAIEPFSWSAMRTSLFAAKSKGKIDRLIADTPEWSVHEFTLIFGKPAYTVSLQWFNYIRMGMDAGYYAIANVSHAKDGINPDHWVLLCGAREVNRDLSDGVATIDKELLVSCSSRTTPDEEWVKTGDFLRDWGGYNAILARPIS